MAKRLQAVRGMNDLLPEQTPGWQWMERCIADTLRRYGYDEIRLPIMEPTALFARSIGEVTDIVEKEMYTFEDRNGDSVTLRPEGTAGCVRAGEQHGLLYNQVRRLWYMGPMFRHERPQKGRYRQFHQVGAEVFGLAGPDIDAELILLCARLWKELGIQDHVTLQVNSLGTSASRGRYRDALVAFLTKRRSDLDADSQRRLDTNPLRILDSKDGGTQSLLVEAPQLADFLDAESAEHFYGFLRYLDQAGIPYTVNQRLVRGLDYYGRTVFEWVTDSLGAQGTVCAGGRYDGLVEHLGGKPTPAVGFALGLERLLLLLETAGALSRVPDRAPQVCLVALGEAAEAARLTLAERLRDDLPGLRVLSVLGGGGMKSRMKKADQSGARFALIQGEDELHGDQITVRDLRREGAQVTVPAAEIAGWLRERLAD